MNREEVLRELGGAVNTLAGQVARLEGGPDGDRMRLMVNGRDMSTMISVFPERTGKKYSRKETGRMRMSIGPYGDKAQFVQRKDGSFDWDRAAGVLVAIATRKDLEKAGREALALNEEAAARVRSAVGLGPGSRVQVDPSKSKGILIVSLTLAVSSNEAGAQRVAERWKKFTDKEKM